MKPLLEGEMLKVKCVRCPFSKVLKVLCLGSWGVPRGLVVFFWARYPCTVGINIFYDNCVCKVLKVLLPRVLDES